jgi:phenylpropionate dioxygenase-like ring-hydroxylating dioxygenase large terminal subunit
MFLENAWYVAAWASEIPAEGLFHRRYLDQPVLIYRQQSGAPVALADRCPHRFAPLHRGRRVGDHVECGYHGLQFDGRGACVLSPHGDGKIPAAAKVRAYPLIERDSLVWIWMGDPARADAARIPNYAFLVDPKRGTVGGYQLTRAHYELMIDNLLDLSHTQFLHRGFQDAEGFLRGQVEIVEGAASLDSNLWAPNGKAPAFFAPRLADPTGTVDMWFDMHWDAPSNLRLTGGVTPSGQSRAEGVDSISAHILTPETLTTCHYFFANARTDRVGDPAADAAVRNWQKVGFGEQDKPMIEAIQANMGTADLMSLKPALFSIDSAPIRARRKLAQLIEAEKGGRAAQAA